MKRVLFGVDSLFQLMVVVNLRTTVYKEWKADLILYDSMAGAEKIIKQIHSLDVFDRAYLARTPLTRCGGSYSALEKLPKYFVYLETLVVPDKAIKKIICNDLEETYDHFCFNGYGALPDCIFNVCKRKNANLECYRFEDGWISYCKEYLSTKGHMRQQFEKIIGALFNRQDITQSTKGYYMMAPELLICDLPYPAIKIPQFSRNNKVLVEALNKIFDYDCSKYRYEQKVILFEDGMMFFQNNNEEVDIVRALTSEIDPKSIGIKMHPRRKENRFEQFGCVKLEPSQIPWELIMLNNRFSGDTFMTVSSGSVVSSDLYFEDTINCVYLCNALKEPLKGTSEYLTKFIANYQKKSQNKNICFPANYEEIVECVKNK